MMTASLPANALIHETHWIHLEWRSITPATTMVYLIVMIWAVLRAREISDAQRRSSWRGWRSAYCTTSIFTTGPPPGSRFLLALALDSGNRRVYFHAGWIGGLIGAPGVSI